VEETIHLKAEFRIVSANVTPATSQEYLIYFSLVKHKNRSAIGNIKKKQEGNMKEKLSTQVIGR